MSYSVIVALKQSACLYIVSSRYLRMDRLISVDLFLSQSVVVQLTRRVWSKIHGSEVCNLEWYLTLSTAHESFQWKLYVVFIASFMYTKLVFQLCHQNGSKVDVKLYGPNLCTGAGFGYGRLTPKLVKTWTGRHFMTWYTKRFFETGVLPSTSASME